VTPTLEMPSIVVESSTGYGYGVDIEPDDGLMKGTYIIMNLKKNSLVKKYSLFLLPTTTTTIELEKSSRNAIMVSLINN